MRQLAFLICDDIRAETSGKSTLVGVYADAMVFGPNSPDGIRWPIVSRLGVFIRFALGEDDPIPDSFVLRFVREGVKGSEVGAQLGVSDRNQPVTIQLALTPFAFRGTGRLEFHLELRHAGVPLANQLPPHQIEIRALPGVPQVQMNPER